MLRSVGLEVKGIVAALSRNLNDGETFERSVNINCIRSAEDCGFICIEAARRAV